MGPELVFNGKFLLKYFMDCVLQVVMVFLYGDFYFTGNSRKGLPYDEQVVPKILSYCHLECMFHDGFHFCGGGC